MADLGSSPPPAPTYHLTKIISISCIFSNFGNVNKIVYWSLTVPLPMENLRPSPVEWPQIRNSTVLENSRDFLFLANPLFLDDEWGPALPSLALSVRLEADFRCGIAVSHTLDRLPSVVLLLSWDDFNFGCGICNNLMRIGQQDEYLNSTSL